MLFWVQINMLVYVTVTTVPFLNSKYKTDTALVKIWSFARTVHYKYSLEETGGRGSKVIKQNVSSLPPHSTVI